MRLAGSKALAVRATTVVEAIADKWVERPYYYSWDKFNKPLPRKVP